MVNISGSMFRDSTTRELTPDEEVQKRAIWDAMSPRRRKYVERIGYENWDPFQKPNDPLDTRQDITKRTTQQLVREFLQTASKKDYTNEYGRGALETALGIVNKDEKYRGVFDFCVWYYNILIKEGHVDEG